MATQRLDISPEASVTAYTSPEPAFWVNSYLVETPSGVVIVDTQFTVSEAAQVRSLAHSLGKPLLAVLLTHPHPDHVNGTGVLLAGLNAAPVVATQATRDGIAALAGPKREQWKPILGDDYPDETALPDTIVGDGGTVEFGGVTFRLSDLGPAESLNESVIEIPEHRLAFVGDLFYHQAHPWLVEGRTGLWLDILGPACDQFADDRTLLPGHGPAATASAITAQSVYIQGFRDLVRAEMGLDGTVDMEGREHIKAALAAAHPNWALATLHDMNITGVAAELAAAAAS